MCYFPDRAWRCHCSENSQRSQFSNVCFSSQQGDQFPCNKSLRLLNCFRKCKTHLTLFVLAFKQVFCILQVFSLINLLNDIYMLDVISLQRLFAANHLIPAEQLWITERSCGSNVVSLKNSARFNLSCL